MKFTNSRSYPIKIEGSAENGVVTFAIYGIEEDTEYTINIIPVVTSSIPYTTQTKVDYSLAPGETYADPVGQGGARVTTYKETILNGEVISKEEITSDVYQAMTRVVYVGPDSAPAAPSTPVSAEPVPEPISEPEPEPISEPVSEPVSEPAPETTPEPELPAEEPPE